MLRNRNLIAFGVCLLVFFANAAAQEKNVSSLIDASPKTARDIQPADTNQEKDINSLIAAAASNTQKDALSNYTYQLRLFRRSKMQKTSWLYEAILPSRMPPNRICRHSLIMIERNDKPVPFEILDSNRRTAIKELESAETDDANLPGKDTQDDGGYVTINYTSAEDNRKNFRVDLLSLLRVSKFSNLKQETINGRDAFIIEFTADNTAKLPVTLSYFTKLRGYIWIDTKDKRIVQVEGFPLPIAEQAPKQSKAKTNAPAPTSDVVFFFSQFRTREGYWFPQIIRLNFLNHPEMQNGFAYDTEYNFENYQHLRVDTSNGG